MSFRVESRYCSIRPSVLCRKHCIEQEKQWDFLKELTAKIPDVAAEVENPEEAPPTSKRGRYGTPF